MKMSIRACLIPLGALVVAACGNDGQKPDAPTGQVVAKVGGEEITARELNLEMQGATSTNAQSADAAQRQALQGIINRKLFAKAARDEGLDESPNIQLSRQRAEELVLAQSLQQQIAEKLPRPTRDEAERYIAANPGVFSQRRVYIVDQVQFVSTDPEKIKMLRDLDSLDEVEAKLLESGIEYQRVPSSIDGRSLPPAAMAQLAKFAAGEIFIMPAGGGVTVNQIRDTRVMPVSGEKAIAQAQQLLFNQRVNKAVMARLDALRKEAGGITYKQGYGPPAANGQPRQPAGQARPQTQQSS